MQLYCSSTALLSEITRPFIGIASRLLEFSDVKTNYSAKDASDHDLNFSKSLEKRARIAAADPKRDTQSNRIRWEWDLIPIPAPRDPSPFFFVVFQETLSIHIEYAAVLYTSPRLLIGALMLRCRYL